MKPTHISIAILLVSLFVVSSMSAQAPVATDQNAASPAPAVSTGEVPRLIKFSGTLRDEREQPLQGPVGVTFALYAQQTGGAAVWMETQNVKPDGSGNYAVFLGANSANGVPAELFVSGEARWLGIQVGQQPEHERILLVSVPYALKAGDAQTLGGLPASAFLLAQPGASVSGGAAATPTNGTVTTAKAAETGTKSSAGVTTAAGPVATNYIPVFTSITGTLGSSVMYQSGANIGVGTTTPALAVDVVGNNAGLRLSGTGTHQVTVTGATSGRLGQDANGFFFASDTNGSSVRFLTNNGTLNEWMRITSAGNVGINAATPKHQLEVVDPGRTGLRVQTNTTGGTVASFGGNGDFQIDLPGTAGGRFNVTENGNVGIGLSAAPNANLQVGDCTGIAGFTACGSIAAIHVGGGGNGLNFSDAGGYVVGYAQNGGDIQLRSNNNGLGQLNSGFPSWALQVSGNQDATTFFRAPAGSSSLIPLMTITGGGGMGIGTASPATALHVSSAADTEVSVQSTATGGRRWTIQSSATGGLAGVFQIIDRNAGASRLSIDGGGNVGIGTTTPANTLEVRAGGTTLADAWTMRSSARLKANIHPILGAVVKVQQLRGVTYDWKSSGKHDVGLIAEEVAQVVPEVVSFDAQGEAQGLDYARLTALLIEAVKQQQTQINEQKAQIKKLQFRLRKVERQSK